LLAGLGAWRTTRALIGLHRLDGLARWALGDLGIKDFLQVRLLVESLRDLVERFHARIRRLLVHLSLVVTCSATTIEASDFARRTSFISNVLNDLVPSVAQSFALVVNFAELVALGTVGMGLRIVRRTIRTDFLSDFD